MNETKKVLEILSIEIPSGGGDYILTIKLMKNEKIYKFQTNEYFSRKFVEGIRKTKYRSHSPFNFLKKNATLLM